MNRRQRIITEPPEHAILLGITTTLKAYKFAWLINKITTLQLAKAADLYFTDTSYATRFLFATEHCTYGLTQNRGITDHDALISYLVPGLKHFDFFFSVQDLTQTFDVRGFYRALVATNKMTYIADIDLAMYKDRIHLLFY
ncbi:MAG: IPExxxVDY family protein [Bacteroidota bacterium]